jgi:hypothetical protein
MRVVWRLVAALTLAIGVVAPVWGAGATSAQESLPDIAGAVPESAVVFHWTDLDRDGAQWKQAEALLARVGLPDALGLWEEAVLEGGEQSGDITQEELDALLGGEMAIVVLPAAVEHFAAMAMAGIESDMTVPSPAGTPIAAGDDQPTGIVAVLQPRDIAVAWSYAERQFADAAAEMGVSVEESTHGGADVLSLPAGERSADHGMGHDDAMKDVDHMMGGHGMYGHGGFAAARAGDFIVAGKTAADLTEAIDVIEGNAASLAESTEAQAVLAELPGDSLSFLYVDGQGILDALDPEAIAMLQSAMMETPVELLGSQFGLTISADEPGFRLDTVTILNGAVDLAAMTVENDPAVVDAAERAPADTFIFQAGRLPEGAYLGAPYQFAQVVNVAEAGEDWSQDDDAMPFPTEEEVAEEIATASATLDFDIETDLFDLLGDEYIAFASFPNITFEDFGIDAVAAISTTDPDALQETMAKIAAWIDRSDFGVDVSARQLAEARVFVASDREMEGAPGLEFGVVEEQAVVGFGGGIDALTTKQADSLAGDEQFQTVMGLLPDAYYDVGYVDVSRAIDPVMNLIGMLEAMGIADTPESMATPVAETGSPRNIRALATVSFQEGNVSGSSTILYIDEG